MACEVALDKAPVGLEDLEDLTAEEDKEMPALTEVMVTMREMALDLSLFPATQ